MSLLRMVTSLWPRSESERFADRLWPDRPQPVIGDDSFDIDRAPAAPAAVGDSPAGERIPQHMPPAGRSTWWCAECGKEMHTKCAAGSSTRPGMFCSSRCADGMSEQAALICDVLTRYVAEFGAIDSGPRAIDVAKGIADRIERAAPSAPFTAEAESLIQRWRTRADNFESLGGIKSAYHMRFAADELKSIIST